MSDHEKNPLYLHPILHARLNGIQDAVTAALPAKWKAITGSQAIHRTPAEQFAIYKKGRVFKDGVWKKVGTTFTGKDGFNNKSRHNFLPATSVDIALIQPNGEELSAGKEEKQIKKGATKFGLEWGGDWSGFQDMPHIQIPLAMLYKSSLIRDEALQWQKYLFHAGTLVGEDQLDGAWGDNSRKALDNELGTRERTPDAWAALFKKYGPIEALKDFDKMSWIPTV